MQCPQCGKWFTGKDINETFCSIERFTKAQLERINYCSPKDFKIYHNGEEVKRIGIFEDKQRHD